MLTHIETATHICHQQPELRPEPNAEHVRQSASVSSTTVSPHPLAQMRDAVAARMVDEIALARTSMRMGGADEFAVECDGDTTEVSGGK